MSEDPKSSSSFWARLHGWVGPVHLAITLFMLLTSVAGFLIKDYYGDNHATIVVSRKTLHFGTASLYKTRSEARKVAKAMCKKEVDGISAKDCKVAVWFYENCGALAIYKAEHSKDNAWGTSWAASKKVAEQRALENCKLRSREGKCIIATSFCSIGAS